MGKVLHASKSGYFPFCDQNSLDFSNDLKIDGSLEQIMSLYWRVKRFKYALTGQYTAPFADTITISGGSGVFAQNIYPENEENLVCSGPILFTGSATLSTPAITVTPNFYMRLFEASFLSPVPFFQSTGSTYKTYFQIESDAAFGQQFINSISRNPETSVPCGTYSVEILSQILKSGTLFQDFSTNYSGNVSLVIEPSEYWSYEGTYDTVTGAPL